MHQVVVVHVFSRQQNLVHHRLDPRWLQTFLILLKLLKQVPLLEVEDQVQLPFFAENFLQTDDVLVTAVLQYLDLSCHRFLRMLVLEFLLLEALDCDWGARLPSLSFKHLAVGAFSNQLQNSK
jgi:hypothetical protein